tara:strand:- start:29 stop:232 length:204 start_codon:yes stop_codon:yes gene_type:complete
MFINPKSPNFIITKTPYKNIHSGEQLFDVVPVGKRGKPLAKMAVGRLSPDGLEMKITQFVSTKSPFK